MNQSMQGKNVVVAVVGAVVGGVLGHLVACWIARYAILPLVLPGAALGWGAGLFVKDRSVVRAGLCGIAAVGLGLFTDWRIEPFIADQGLGYYFAHLHQLGPMRILMVAAGGLCGAWLSLGREQSVLNPAPGPQPPKARAL